MSLETNFFGKVVSQKTVVLESPAQAIMDDKDGSLRVRSGDVGWVVCELRFVTGRGTGPVE